MQDPTGAELAARVEESLAERFGEQLRVDPGLAGLDELARLKASIPAMRARA